MKKRQISDKQEGKEVQQQQSKKVIYIRTREAFCYSLLHFINSRSAPPCGTTDLNPKVSDRHAFRFHF